MPLVSARLGLLLVGIVPVVPAVPVAGLAPAQVVQATPVDGTA